MRLYISLLFTLLSILTGGCCISPDKGIVTIGQIVLLDVQGLEGGRDLWIDSDGKTFCRVVMWPEDGQSGLQETRYMYTIPDEQLTSLHTLLNKHQFCSLKTEERYGLPDEARPIIYIRTGEQTCIAAKWANDIHHDFDPIYEQLLTISENRTQGTQIGSGTYDRDWKPSGFPENRTIYYISDQTVK